MAVQGPPPADGRHPKAGLGWHLSRRMKLDGTTVCCIPRCGSQSMRAALFGAGAAMDWDEDPPNRTVMWIRHPFDRFATIAMMFKDAFGGYQELADAILAGAQNVHWLPQTMIHDIPHAVVYPFETINETWPIEFPDAPLPHRNATHQPQAGRIRLAWDEIEPLLKPETVEGLREYYAKDFEVYESSITRTV